ncbi:hypothetical protein BC936DRAFT_138949 [Jimgerdemannia flammicorona]|uniref:Uncharacterized protein n=1 Tax=Jimgerdemannia flammicorona TaxID=994334 RepID=A0A433BCQ2_9FUNG|nr:hypothetical protein BC936DRAFT_138949 [Jimgerdemannia flammicorona]
MLVPPPIVLIVLPADHRYGAEPGMAHTTREPKTELLISPMPLKDLPSVGTRLIASPLALK